MHFITASTVDNFPYSPCCCTCTNICPAKMCLTLCMIIKQAPIFQMITKKNFSFDLQVNMVHSIKIKWKDNHGKSLVSKNLKGDGHYLLQGTSLPQVM